MELRSQLIQDWPKLAWHATWSRTGKTVTLYHGADVEVRHDRAFEGVWDGDFENGEFQRSSVFSGTGIIVRESGVVLVPAAMPQRGYIFVSSAAADEQHASNSLLCWLQQTHNKLRSDYADYYADITQIARKGWTVHLPHLTLANEQQVGVVFLGAWSISGESQRRLPVQKGPTFESNFDAYKTHLQITLRRLLMNAQDPKRITSLKPIVPLSTGFDSCGVAAIAKELGVKESYTILGREDARKVASFLGMKLQWKHRAMSFFLRHSRILEAFAMPLGNGRSVCLFESSLEDAIRISGHGGDSMWGMDMKFDQELNAPSLPLAMVGMSLLEWKLRVGMHTISVPFIGVWHNATIKAITHSDEMKPWLEATERLQESRPIARRLGMEAGLPRSAFGQKKTAGTITSPEIFKGLWYLSFHRFLKRNVPDPSATTLNPKDGWHFHGTPFRWLPQWAHQQLANRYTIPHK